MPIKPERLKEAARRLREEANAAAGSAEEYIRKKLEAVRAAGLKTSRERTEPVPVGEVRVTGKELEGAIKHLYMDAIQAYRNADAYANAKSYEDAVYNYGAIPSRSAFESDDRSQREHARMMEKRLEARFEQDAMEYESGERALMREGETCAQTGTSANGMQYAQSGNQTILAHPELAGLFQIPFSEAKPGDFIQAVSDSGIPYHGMILDNIDDDGFHYYNYSDGGIGPDHYLKSAIFYPSHDNERFRNAYRFAGTPADSLRWRQEWEEQNGFACGGKKFDEGGYKDKLINWSVNHPGALWADTKEAAKAREWLRKNAPEELSALYWNESDDIRKGIDRRFVPDDAKEKEMQFNVTGGISDAGRNIADKVEDVAAWIPGPIGAGVWLGNMAGDISDGNYGKVALDLGLMALMGGAGHYAGKAIGKYAPRLMQKFPRLGKAFDFLDDITWNDARRADASDLWSRNLDARQAFGVAPESIDPVTGVSSGLIYGPREVSISSDDARDIISNELFLRWLEINDPAMHDSLLKDRRLRHISKRMLEGSDVKNYVSPDIYQQMLDGTFPWENNKYIEKYFPTEKIIDGSGRNVFWDWRGKMRDAISPVSGFDVPLGYNVLPFTDKLKEFVKVRDAAYDITKARAAAGEMSPVVQPLIKDVNDATWIMGKTTYPTTETSFSKPAIHFTDTRLDDSFSHGNSVTIGLRDYFDPAMDQHDWFHSHYGKDIFADPYFIIGHEVGHKHPGFNTMLSKQAREAIKGKTNLARDIVFMRKESPRYGNTYYGLNGKARTSLTPTRTIDPVIDPHDAEFSEWFSDKLGDATMMKMWGINDGTRPYTMKDLDRLTKKMEELYGKGAKTRFSWFFETPEARLNALNNGWANGGQMNRFDGGGRYYKVPTPIADGQNASNYVDEQPNYSDGMFGGIDVGGFYDAMGKLRMPLPEVQAANVEPVRVDTTPEWYNMVPLLYDVPTGMYSFQQAGDGSVASIPTDLFSDEAKALRRLRHAYVESRFNRNAENKDSGARGLFQIMPIAEKDYLGRGRGKQGDIWNADYNGGIRDWVMKIIPGDLQEFWSDNDSDINKFAKLYAAYNWGAGNLRKFFRDRLEAGLSNDDPYEWVETIKNKGSRPDETKNYVKFLALNQDIPDSYMTTDAFEKAAKARGYMAEGGRLFETGGPEKTWQEVPLSYASENQLFRPLQPLRDPVGNDKFVYTFGNWLNNRRDILAKNMADTGMDSGERRYFALPLYNTLGLSQEEKAVNDELESQLARVEDAGYVEKLLPLFTHGQYNTKKNTVELSTVLGDSGNPKDVVALHEYGHALGQGSPQEEVIRRHFSGRPVRDKYLDDPSEIYTRLMTFRKLHNIDPNKVYTLADIKELRGEAKKDFDEVITKPWTEHDKLQAEYAKKLADFLYPKLRDKVKDKWWWKRNGGGEGFYRSLKSDFIYARDLANQFGVEIPSEIQEIFDRSIKVINNDNSLQGVRYSEDNDFFKRMSDEDMLFLLNEVADSGDQESLYGNHLGNISAKGGHIHIKPSHRGRLTELKARTGKTEAELYNDGNPAHKRMVVFARNSRKWKHGDGGPIDRYSPEQIRAAIAKLKGMQK